MYRTHNRVYLPETADSGVSSFTRFTSYVSRVSCILRLEPTGEPTNLRAKPEKLEQEITRS